MSGTVIVAVISFAGTLVGTIGGIIASGKLVNYRLEQLEKKVDLHNRSTEKIPLMEERQRIFEKRLSAVENGGNIYEGFKSNHCANGNACNCDN